MNKIKILYKHKSILLSMFNKAFADKNFCTCTKKCDKIKCNLEHKGKFFNLYFDCDMKVDHTYDDIISWGEIRKFDEAIQKYRNTYADSDEDMGAIYHWLDSIALSKNIDETNNSYNKSFLDLECYDILNMNQDTRQLIDLLIMRTNLKKNVDLKPFISSIPLNSI